MPVSKLALALPVLSTLAAAITMQPACIISEIGWLKCTSVQSKHHTDINRNICGGHLPRYVEAPVRMKRNLIGSNI